VSRGAILGQSMSLAVIEVGHNAELSVAVVDGLEVRSFYRRHGYRDRCSKANVLVLVRYLVTGVGFCVASSARVERSPGAGDGISGRRYTGLPDSSRPPPPTAPPATLDVTFVSNARRLGPEKLAIQLPKNSMEAG
jgi:hypothetical protein